MEFLEIPEALKGIRETLRNIPEEFRNVPESLKNVPEGLQDLLEPLKNVPEALRNLPEGLRNVLEELKNVLKRLWNVLEQPGNANQRLMRVSEEFSCLLLLLPGSRQEARDEEQVAPATDRIRRLGQDHARQKQTDQPPRPAVAAARPRDR